jgi:AraC family transcriptional regulator
MVPGASVMLGRFPGALRLAPHAHERACITVLLDGVMAERIGGREQYCERASVLIKPGLERHDDVFGHTGSTQIIIEPDDSESDVWAASKELLSSVRFFRDADAERLGLRLALELDHPDDVTPLAAAALIFELFAGVARRGGRRRGVGAQPPWLQRTRAQLEDTTAESPNLAALARAADVHPAHLARVFRAHFGCSIGTFVRQQRIQAAATKLATTDDTIAGIALAHGFVDQSHFTRQFRRHFGLTPRAYRERFRTR